MSDPADLVLAGEFPAVTRQQWQALVSKVLKGAGGDSPERELTTVTADGIEIAPLYVGPQDQGRPDPSFPGQAPFVRGRTAAGHRDGWDVRQRHEHPDPAVSREQIMEDLEGGVSSLWLGLDDGQIPVDALPDVLAEVYLDLAPVVLDAGGQFSEAAEVFLSTAARRGVAPDALAGCLGADPLGVLARTGAGLDAGAPPDAGVDLAAAATLAGRCSAEFPGLRAIVVDALPCHDAGGTDAQELGYALAAGVEYLRVMRTAGLSGAAAFGQMEFRYAATADQFATIAKLRAGRRAWARVAQQCGVTSGAAGQRQHAVSSWPMLTRRDPWNNILRATLACFGAGLGGADAVTVIGFDAALGQSDRLARRVARNLHALLIEESHVARVIDPAGGSWYVEDLTEQLARRAWTCFQDIERSGGLRAALASGVIADQLTASREARRDTLGRRREAITGVSEFPLVGETLLSRPAVAPSVDGPRGLPRIRWAQWHEELRDRADAHARETGSPPTLILVLLDRSRQSLARAERVSALLAPAGIKAVTADVDPGTGSGADGDGVAGGLAPVIVVCGSPDATAEEVGAAVGRAREQGAATVVVAAGPAEGAAEATVSGADEMITDGMDVLAFGDRMLTALGVPR